MKKVERIVSFVFAGIMLLGCEKIPSRGFIDLEVISVGGVAYVENQIAMVPYEEETSIQFSYVSDAPLDSVFVKLVDSFAPRIDSSDGERIAGEPAQGDTEGTFSYQVNPSEQFDALGSNPISNRKFIKVVMINDVGMIRDFNLTVEAQ